MMLDPGSACLRAVEGCDEVTGEAVEDRFQLVLVPKGCSQNKAPRA